MPTKTNPDLKQQLWELRNEYINNLEKYSFAKAKDLKPMFQNAASYQAIATKHFLQFALQRIDLAPVPDLSKTIEKDSEQSSNAMDNYMWLLTTYDFEWNETIEEWNEAVSFKSEKQEIEFVFDNFLKEVKVKVKKGSEELPIFCCDIPFKLFNILNEYINDER